MRTVHRPLGFCMGLGLIHQVRHPGGDRLHHDLRALALQEVEHVEVAVAFGDLRPEFAGDLHYRLDLGAIHFDRFILLASSFQRIQIILAPHVLVPSCRTR